MKITKEIEEFINLTITEHMGKEYADWKLSQPSNSGAETEEFFYRLGLRDGMKLRKNVKMVLKQLSE